MSTLTVQNLKLKRTRFIALVTCKSITIDILIFNVCFSLRSIQIATVHFDLMLMMSYVMTYVIKLNNKCNNLQLIQLRLICIMKLNHMIMNKM